MSQQEAQPLGPPGMAILSALDAKGLQIKQIEVIVINQVCQELIGQAVERTS